MAQSWTGDEEGLDSTAAESYFYYDVLAAVHEIWIPSTEDINIDHGVP